MAGLLNALVQARRSGRGSPAAVPPQRGGSGTGGADPGPPDGGGAPADGALTAATQRVRLIVEGPDDPDETERAVEALGSQPGWRVRPAQARDRVAVADGRAVLVVDALAYGQRRTAVDAVRAQVTRLLRRPPVGFRIREARLVRYEEERDTTLVRVVRRTPPGAGRFRRWLGRHAEALGGADTGHVLTVPRLPGEDAEQLKARVKARWADLTHGAEAFDDDLHDLRLSVGPRPESGTGTDPGPDPQPVEPPSPSRARLRRFRSVALPFLAVPVPLASAWVLASFSSPWRFLVLLAPLAALGPVGYWVTSNEPRPRLLRLACGAIVVGGFTWVTYEWLVNSPAGFGAQLLGLGQGLLILATAVGCWHAFSRSWLSRHILLLLPVLLAPLPFVLPWVGSFLHTAYLEEALGIPEPAVHVSFYWRYFVALKPVVLTLAITLLFVAFYGWAKYFNLHISQGVMMNGTFPLLVLVAVLGMADLTLKEARAAAERAYLAATRGEDPPSYFGVDGRLVCVRPVEPGKPVSVHPGPLPTGRPVLAFPREGGDLWVWDPSPGRGPLSTDHAVRMRAEDVSLYPATGTTCP
ncbi:MULTISPECIES: hypothetical protein [unclassified Streptomyces]|uniref:hypothetical protein n=1 Tax=unclassified Streptomyces TaxID=2593676 RepID=UPI0006B0011C|nr:MULTISPECIES: hypothetical protein [unclassified Streptomyces]KOX37855.1 hypothetical protein ADL06_02260 [Streptomyces sp. NRRL F-6491]KOX40783.1 hypothetical protein ADL08_21500 [Streptomyces sp. NRRL F-6492]